MIKFATGLVFILGIGSISFAQSSGRIAGVVTDAATGDPLPGATVMLVGTSFGAASDLDGKYEITGVLPGSYTLRATYVGWQREDIAINITQGEILRENLELVAVGVQGKTVMVTAQAYGQNSAINQQLSSDKIENVVSAAKIQELPDANAAESVGRLPGISLIREGGEASQVVIRGLAPQYNQVSIDGVMMPANASSEDVGLTTVADAGNRGADLSMISSNMLGGITVTKAITPDMDAAVIGGVVDFDLREAQSTSGIAKANFAAQGGYDNLQTSLGPYKFVASAENRFLDSKLGVFAEASAERVDLSSNTFGGSYYPQNLPPIIPYLGSFGLSDNVRNRQRYGGTVTLDYRMPDGKIDFMNFVSRSDTKGLNYSQSYVLTGPDISYGMTDSRSYLNVITDLLDFRNSFSVINVDAKLSHSYTENHDPNALSVGFVQNGAGLASSYGNFDPRHVPAIAQINDTLTGLSGITNYNNFSRDREFTGSLDLLSHINFSDLVTSTLKFGGAYRYTIRSYTYSQGDGILNQGSGQNLRADIIAAYPWMAQPPYNQAPFSQKTDGSNNIMPILFFEDPSFSFGNFLNGQYTMGPATNVGMLRNVLSIAQKYGTLDSYTNNRWASLTYDYNGHEYEEAGYVMYSLNVGPTFTFIPGVRYQNLTTSYTAPRLIETPTSRLGNNVPIYGSNIDTTMKIPHGYWLPMVHLIYKPLSWFQVHLAYTNTLTYPDYRAIIPWIDIGTGGEGGIPITWNNYALKPGQSANYDVVLSAYDNTLGLLSVDGFLKRITNLIFPLDTHILNLADIENYPGVPQSSQYVGSPVYTYINNPYPVNDWGVETDWQTHFWYLPGPLSGLVLSANYTHIFTGAKYRLDSLKINTSNPRHPVSYVQTTYYTDRLIDQPNDVGNLAIGYDFKGFSIRVSMIYQSNMFTGDNAYASLRSYTTSYVRWDVSAKQNLPMTGMQVYFDLNNLNSENDVSIIAGSGFPTSEQDYGMTADLGLRLAL